MAETKIEANSTAAVEHMGEEIAELEQPMLHSWLPWLVSAAALVLLACLLAFFFILEPRVASPRGPQSAQGLRIVNLAEPIGRLREAPSRFRWDPIQGATLYIVAVMEEDSSRPVLVRPVEALELEPTDIELSLLRPGLYTWTVEARLRDGTPVGQGEGAFVLEAPHS